MTASPRISLCVVARNEARFIAACIEGARPVVDEAIVVDTGSTDDTREIAAAAGARVIQADWPGDLGRAHDLPIAHATGDWILVLDGDEVLDPAAAPALRAYVAAGGHDGYKLPIRNYTWAPMVKWRRADAHDPLARGALGYLPSAPVRLFRHRRDYVHEGFLHQSVGPSIRAAGGSIGSAAVPIHHYGYLRIDRTKSWMYMALARRQAEVHPRSARAWIDLGQPLLEWGNLPAARAAFEQARRLGRDASACYWLGETLLTMGHARAALLNLHEAVARNRRDDAPDFDNADAWERIAHAHEALGQPRRAIAAYHRALALRPDSPVALNDLAALLAEQGAPAQAEPLVRRLLADYPGLDMAWATLGTLRALQGDLTGARRALETALDIEPRSGPARTNLAVVRARAAGRRRPRREAPRAHRAVPLGRRGVVSLIAHLSGGGGRVLVDVVRALHGRPQVVVCFETDAHAGLGLSAELSRLGVRVVSVSSQRALLALLRRLEPEVVVDHWWPNRLSMDAVRVGGERWIAVVHDAAPVPAGYDDYVVNSEFQARRQGHLPADRVHAIHNAVDLARFALRSRGGSSRGPVTIAMLSRLDPGKFSRRLLDYLPRLDALGARLLIAGRGARRHELEPEIAERGLGDVVRFVGPVASRRVPAFLAAADIGLHLTETAEETGSLSVLEMLASGLPVVTEPKGCLREMVTPDVSGYLSLEPTEIAAALERLILSPALRRRMGAASRRAARAWSMATFRKRWRMLLRGPAVRALAKAPGDAPRRYALWRPPLTYLVCGTPRAGSGLLCEALGATGLVGIPDDFFEPDTARTLARRWGELSFPRYVERALEEGATPNGVSGARLTLDGLALLRHELGADALAEHFPGLRWVWVTRRDRLRQAISWVRARRTGVWVRMDGEAQPPVARGALDTNEIARAMEAIEQQEVSWSDWFAKCDGEPLRIAYEQIATDPEAAARRVAGHLGVVLPRRLHFGERRMRAMADATTETWVQQFQKAPASYLDRAMVSPDARAHRAAAWYPT